MNENIKTTKKETVVKGDSTVNTVDVKSEKIDVEEMILPGGYVQINELSIDEIKKLPRFMVEFSCKETSYNGTVRTYPLITLILNKNLKLTSKRDDFSESDFAFLKHTHFVPNLKMDLKAESYTNQFPVRFCKGRKVNSLGEISNFYYVQIFVKKGCIYSMYINRKNNQFNLFKYYVEQGVIPFEGWAFNDKVKDDSKEADDGFNYMNE